MPATGARPAGAADEATAAEAVRQMFDSIAPRYDLLNHVLSANVDRLWWRRTARSFRAVLARPEAAILDICCGTGDLTMALLKLRPRGSRPILAGDFARAMLSRGAQKFGARELRGIRKNAQAARRHTPSPLEADALHLPLRAGSLDLIVTAFGFRNLANYEAGPARVSSRAETRWAVGDSGVQRARRLIGKAYARVLPARVAGHRTHDLRQEWPLQLPASFGRRFSAARRDAGDDAAAGYDRLSPGSRTRSASPGCTPPMRPPVV